MYEVPELPWPILTGLVAETVKLGACTLNVMVLVTTRLPEVPVIVRGYVPPRAEPLASKVSTLVPEVGFVPHEAVTPLGRPVTARFTLPLKPYCGVIVIVELTELLWFTLTLLGDSEIT